MHQRIAAPLDQFTKTGYFHTRTADLPWPVRMPDGPGGGDATAAWALAELARIGVAIPAALRNPAAQILFDVYELGYDNG